MDTWHNGTTWEEFANTAPCNVRPKWIAAFRSADPIAYAKPADLYFSFVRTLEANADPIETTVNFLRARQCPMYAEEVRTLVGVILMGIDDLQSTDALWVSPNTPWRVSPTEWRLLRADREATAVAHEIEMIQHRLAQANERTKAIETARQEAAAKQEEAAEVGRNATALRRMEPQIKVTIMSEALRDNGMYLVIRLRWRDVYARGGVVMFKRRGEEYRLDWGVGGGYIARSVSPSDCGI